MREIVQVVCVPGGGERFGGCIELGGYLSLSVYSRCVDVMVMSEVR